MEKVAQAPVKKQKSILSYFKPKQDNSIPSASNGIAAQKRPIASLSNRKTPDKNRKLFKKPKVIDIVDLDGVDNRNKRGEGKPKVVDVVDLDCADKPGDGVETTASKGPLLSDVQVLSVKKTTARRSTARTSSSKFETNVNEVVVKEEIPANSLKNDENSSLNTTDASQSSFMSMTEYLQISLQEENNIACKVDESSTNDKANENSSDRRLTCEIGQISQDEFNSDYKLKNFRMMVHWVLQDELYKDLFNDDDWLITQKFTSLSIPAQRLYVRLYVRKHRWIRSSKLNYPEISIDLKPHIEELVRIKLFLPCSIIDNLEEALDVLDLAELKICAKSMKGIKVNNSGNKSALKETLIKYATSNQSVTSHFSGRQVSLKDVVLKHVKTLLGDSSYMIDSDYGRLFSRMQYLYYPPQVNEDENGQILSHEFYNALKVASGEVRYPNYSMDAKTPIYRDRKDLIVYDEACRLESQVLTAIQNRKHDYVVTDLLSKCEDEYKQLIANGHHLHDATLPSFLRNMTAGHVYVRCLSHIVTVVEALKDYEKATQMLKTLIDQDVYCLHYRGKWYERLVLDFESHLKEPVEAYILILKSLNDENVKMAFKYTLYKRGRKLAGILEKKKKFNSLRRLPENLPDCEVSKCPEKTIEAPTLNKAVQGRKTIFTSKKDGGTEILPVEEIANLYYQQRGYTNGLHSESTVYHILFNLLFWDIIYFDGLPDAFRTFHQSLPLDFASEHFYLRRKDLVEDRLDMIRKFSDDELTLELETRWNESIGCVCLISWDSMSVEHVQEIALCMGVRPLAAICERLCKNFRFTRSGLPDLLVWNSVERTVKAVEVKGPGDSLSAKQILWLDYLNEWGLPAEVCYVKAALKGTSSNR